MVNRRSPEWSSDNTLDYLVHLRDDFLDEIPTKIIHGKHGAADLVYKVRKNWFQKVHGEIRIAKMENLIPANVVEQALEFCRQIESEDFHKRLTQPEDIQSANKIIDLILQRK